MKYIIAAGTRTDQSKAHNPWSSLVLYLERRDGDRIPDKLTWHVDPMMASRLTLADAVASILLMEDCWMEEAPALCSLFVGSNRVTQPSSGAIVATPATTSGLAAGLSKLGTP